MGRLTREISILQTIDVVERITREKEGEKRERRENERELLEEEDVKYLSITHQYPAPAISSHLPHFHLPLPSPTLPQHQTTQITRPLSHYNHLPLLRPFIHPPPECSVFGTTQRPTLSFPESTWMRKVSRCLIPPPPTAPTPALRPKAKGKGKEGNKDGKGLKGRGRPKRS
ncbi:hypothetical protein BDP27DRAFT_1347165 [Rhodocollybia butyracea]|uniref:Uncharacterized protein n=1 Tax=Rhodocollybia butyracea TaxID=206335 RepID=A0A9P5P843_9AGAR|nr:hypothetical protein BDP27DRAFT_1347165 [Rhodocollybia butyracea]